jgi:hypothetical protein
LKFVTFKFAVREGPVDIAGNECYKVNIDNNIELGGEPSRFSRSRDYDFIVGMELGETRRISKRNNKASPASEFVKFNDSKLDEFGVTKR